MKQANEKWNIGYDLWNSNHGKWNSNVSLWNWLFGNMKLFISNEWNRLFEKCTIEIGVIFVKQASEKWNVGSELWNSKHIKWIIMYHYEIDYSKLWNNLFENNEIVFE